jgi:hypothetical protein
MNTINTVAALAALALVPGALAQAIIYVDDDAPSGGDGSSWSEAFASLEDGLDAVKNPLDQVWVAGGVYTPKVTGDETSTFLLGGDVLVYGGFAGREGSLAERGDPFDNPSVLDGDIASGFNNDINHLVTIDGDARLDGFVIQNANADGAVSAGGGVLVLDGGVVLQNLLVVNCRAGLGNVNGGGGGIAILGDSSVLVRDCAIESCFSHSGGGIAVFDQSTANIDGLTVKD